MKQQIMLRSERHCVENALETKTLQHSHERIVRAKKSRLRHAYNSETVDIARLSTARPRDVGVSIRETFHSSCCTVARSYQRIALHPAIRDQSFLSANSYMIAGYLVTREYDALDDNAASTSCSDCRFNISSK